VLLTEAIVMKNSSSEVAEDMLGLDGMDKPLARSWRAQTCVQNRDDLADLAVDELVELPAWMLRARHR
jgi:N utilization substance protein A